MNQFLMLKNMKKNISFIGYTIFAIIAIALCLFVMPKDPEKPVECKVLKGYQTSAGYKVSAKFILILQDDKGHIFEQNTRPVTFYEATTYKHICLMLNEHDVNPKAGHHGIAFLLGLFIVIFIIIWAIWGLSLILD